MNLEELCNMARYVPPRYAPHIHCTREVLREAFTPPFGREHRLEHVATVENVRWINDSFSTNVNAAWYALSTMSGPVVWLMGGQDMGYNDYRPLLPFVRRYVRDIVCLGLDDQRVCYAFGGYAPVHAPRTMERAVRTAAALVEPGYTVLLSPACASFDRYDNYTHRGRMFRAAVRSL